MAANRLKYNARLREKNSSSSRNHHYRSGEKSAGEQGLAAAADPRHHRGNKTASRRLLGSQRTDVDRGGGCGHRQSVEARTRMTAREGGDFIERTVPFKSVSLCLFESDSQFNGPRTRQIQRKAKVDAEVVERSSSASGARHGPTLAIQDSIGSWFRQLTSPVKGTTPNSPTLENIVAIPCRSAPADLLEAPAMCSSCSRTGTLRTAASQARPV